jgi:hypothetical protein
VSQLQQDFDRVWFAVTEQGCPALDGDVCVLRAKDGARCAIGELLSDDEVATAVLFAQGNWCAARVIPKRMKDHKAFYVRLQMAHDQAAVDTKYGGDFVLSFQNEMLKVAVDFRLTVPATKPIEREHVAAAAMALGDEHAAVARAA